MSATPRLLIVLHQENSTPGRLGHALKQRGFALDIRRPCCGDALPATLAEHAGAIIFGGPMSVNDSDEDVRREIDWIAVPLNEKKPFLGICLGAQMLAHHLGRCEMKRVIAPITTALTGVFKLLESAAAMHP